MFCDFNNLNNTQGLMIMVVPFKNEPGIDFSVQENVDRFNEILKKVKGELGQNIPLFINGEKNR